MILWKAVTLAAVVAVASVTAAHAGDVRKEKAQAKVEASTEKSKIDKNADELLRQMSEYVTGLKSFKLHASVVDEVVTTDGQRVQFLAEQNLAVRRPDKLRLERLGPVADSVFRYDGSQFAIYGKKTGYYATAPAPGQLDEAINTARTRYGVDAPGADLLLSRPYNELMAGVTEAAYLGVEPIGDMSCHHLAFRAAEVDFQVWVQDGNQPVPCRYTIVSKADKGMPEFSVSMTKWETNAALPDSLFAFTPPPGSKRIELKSQQASAKP